MKHQCTWGGVATPEALANCLDHVFQCAYEGAQWLESRANDARRWLGTDQLTAEYRSAVNVRWGFERATSEWNAMKNQYADGVPGFPGSALHLAEVSSLFSNVLISDAREGAVEPECFTAMWAIANFAKKFRFGCQMSDEEAKEGFLKRNAACANNLRFDVRCRMRELLDRALPYVDVREGRFGPGATLEKANTWPEKVKWCASHRARQGLFVWDDKALEVAPRVAKLHAVPKDFRRKRLITVEPLVVAWHQQAARSTILESVHRGSLKGTVMDQNLAQTFEPVPGVTLSHTRVIDPVLRQRDRCVQGARDGSLVTIDLSDASDTISLEAVQSVFPAWCLALLEKCRSTSVWDGHREVPLRMYAGMGNATTFIVETLFFWALFTAVAELTHCGKPQVSVFGDDIVMNGKVARNQWLQGMIRESGLRINWDKSGLSAGPGFREACGAVAYRDVYVPFTPRFYGYAGTKEGAIQYCELTSRLLNSSIPEFKLLGLGLLTWKDAPEAPLLWVRDPEETGACLAYVLSESEAQALPGFFGLLNMFPPRSRKVRLRYNSSLQRNEAWLPAIRAKSASCTLRDPVWGPGVTRSWGWWAYKLALLGQTTHDAQATRKSRVVRYAYAHRTSVRCRWVPVGFLNPIGS